MGWFRRGPDKTYLGLRDRALRVTRDELGGRQSGELLALLMETGYPEAVVTLVGFADGSTSLYFSNGGGVIGAGEHAVVSEATHRWLETGTGYLECFQRADECPLPGEGETQFIAVTTGGTRTAREVEDVLGEGGHELSPLFYAAQDVIGQVRMVEEQRG
jgi:hypothetical protein